MAGGNPRIKPPDVIAALGSAEPVAVTVYVSFGTNPVKVATGGVPATVTLTPPDGFPGLTVVVVFGITEVFTIVYV